MFGITQRTVRDFESDLGIALWEWEKIPRFERRWSEWPEHEKRSLAAEWPLEDQRLDRLAAYVDRYPLTTEQNEKYQRLLQMVEVNRPIVRRLIRSTGPGA